MEKYGPFFVEIVNKNNLTGNLNSLKTAKEGWGIAIMDMEESCPIVEESCPVGRNHYHGL